MLVLPLKPLEKLTVTAVQADRQAGGQDHVLSQADALTKNLWWVVVDNTVNVVFCFEPRLGQKTEV